jgi:hypothetical protein
VKPLIASPRVLLLAALTSLAATAGAHAMAAHRAHCSRPHARTVLSSRAVRVSKVGSRYYGCLRRSGRTVLLGRYTVNRRTDIGDDVFARSALGGTWVAWTYRRHEDLVGTYEQIEARDLRTGRHRSVLATGAGGHPDALAVSPHGALAWLVPDRQGYPVGVPGRTIRISGHRFRTPGDQPAWVAVTRFGSDAHADLAVFATSGMWELAGRGDGSFARARLIVAIPRREADAFGEPIVTDLDGDGIVDLALPSTRGVTIRRGRADGTFAPGTPIAVRGGVSLLRAADLDRDGHVDLVAAMSERENSNAANVWVLRGRGDGTFAPPVASSTGAPVDSFAVGDVTGDGAPDVLATALTSRSAYPVLLRGNGDGTLARFVRLRVGLVDRPLAIGDLDGDGISELVYDEIDYGLDVQHGRGGGAFSRARRFAIDAAAVVLGDVDRDGKPDLVATGADRRTGDGDGVYVFRNEGNGRLAPPSFALANDDAHGIALGDVDGDGKPDAVVANEGSGDVSVLHNRGDGTFASTRPGEDLYAIGRSTRRLLRAAAIAPRSLRFHGATLTWTADDQRGSARPR